MSKLSELFIEEKMSSSTENMSDLIIKSYEVKTLKILVKFVKNNKNLQLISKIKT